MRNLIISHTGFRATFFILSILALNLCSQANDQQTSKVVVRSSLPGGLSSQGLAFTTHQTSIDAVTWDRARDHILGRQLLTPAEQTEADLNSNGRIDVGDVVKLISNPPGPTPTPTPIPTPGLGQFYKQQYNVGYLAGISGTDALDLGVEAVWGASELNGWIETLTGTLTQTAPDSEDWTYSPTPVDRLLLIFSGGPTVEFKFNQFDGYKDGTWQDFTKSHDVDFTVFIINNLDLHVISSATPKEAGVMEWTRKVTGTQLYDGEMVTMDITHTGREESSVDPDFAIYEFQEQYVGTAFSPSGNYTVNQASWDKLIHNSYDAKHIQNHQLWNNSSATEGGVTYTYQDATVRWEMVSFLNQGVYDIVTETDYWLVQGTLLKDGAAFGVLQFDGPVTYNTHGPELILHLNTGENIWLHTLIPYP